jgi:copper resistance protein C
VVTRLVAGALVAILAVLTTAPSAWAQTELTGSDPANGAALAVAPDRITLTFSEPVDADLAVIFVTGGDGRTWPVGEITASGNTLTMPVTPAGPAGQCAITYNIALEDHPLNGVVRFTLTKPAPSSPSTPSTTVPAPPPQPDATTEDSGGSSMWAWVVIGAVIVGVAVGLVVAGSARDRRRRRP